MQAQQNSAPEWGPYGTVGRTIVRFNLPGDPRLSQLVRLADAIDALTDTVGRCCAWLVLAVIVLLFLQLPLREVVQGGHILANDFGQLTHAAVFMVGLSYALRWDRHVRMDVFYRGMGERARATVNLLGAVLFLLPWCALMAWFGWDYALRSARALETFPDTWSPGYFLFKVFLVSCMSLLGLQGLSMVIRNGIRLFTSTEAA